MSVFERIHCSAVVKSGDFKFVLSEHFPVCTSFVLCLLSTKAYSLHNREVMSVHPHVSYLKLLTGCLWNSAVYTFHI